MWYPNTFENPEDPIPQSKFRGLKTNSLVKTNLMTSSF